MNTEIYCAYCREIATHLRVEGDEMVVCTVCGSKTADTPSPSAYLPTLASSKPTGNRKRNQAADIYFPSSKGLETAEKAGKTGWKIFKKLMPLFRALNRL